MNLVLRSQIGSHGVHGSLVDHRWGLVVHDSLVNSWVRSVPHLLRHIILVTVGAVVKG